VPKPATSLLGAVHGNARPRQDREMMRGWHRGARCPTYRRWDCQRHGARFPLTQEMSEAWDKITDEIRKIIASGGILDFPDIAEPKIDMHRSSHVTRADSADDRSLL
jgi:hypothetical protein